MNRVRDMATGNSESDPDSASLVLHTQPTEKSPSTGGGNQCCMPNLEPTATKRPRFSADISLLNQDNQESHSSDLKAWTDVHGNQVNLNQSSVLATLHSSQHSCIPPLMFEKLCKVFRAFKTKCHTGMITTDQLKDSFMCLLLTFSLQHKIQFKNIDDREKHNPKWKAFFVIDNTLCSTYVANSKKVAKEGAIISLLNLWKNHGVIGLIAGSSKDREEIGFEHEMVYMDHIICDTNRSIPQPEVHIKDAALGPPEERKILSAESIVESLPREFALHKLNCSIIPAPKLPNFYLIEFLKEQAKYGYENPVSKLVNSASMCKVPLNFTTEKFVSPRQTMGYVCTVTMLSHTIASGLALGAREAKHLAAHNAIQALKIKNATLRKTDKFEGALVSRDYLTDGSSKEEAVPETNVGHKLLKMMGWKGEGVGLGKKEEGIANPVKATGSGSYTKEGLGFDLLQLKDPSTKRLDEHKVWEVLQEYARSDREEELVFTTELSLDERKKLHTMSCRLGLKSKSKGKGNTRYLTIGRKWDISTLVQSVAEKGGNTGKFELVGPMK